MPQAQSVMACVFQLLNAYFYIEKIVTLDKTFFIFNCIIIVYVIKIFLIAVSRAVHVSSIRMLKVHAKKCIYMRIYINIRVFFYVFLIFDLCHIDS